MNHLVPVIAITALHWGVMETAIEIFISDKHDYTYSHRHNNNRNRLLSIAHNAKLR